MPGRSFEDANAFHRVVRTLATTKVGAVLFRPTAHHLDRLISRLTGGKRTFAGMMGGVPAVILTLGLGLSGPGNSQSCVAT
jgi:hypothetical protein